MLLRVAPRKAQGDPFRHLQLLADQLLLPWLYPAQCFRRHFSGGKPAPNGDKYEGASITKRKSHVGLHPPRVGQRYLATAVAEAESTYDEPVPFVGMSRLETPRTVNQHPWIGSSALSDLKPFDPTAPLMLSYSQPMMMKKRVRAANGISSDLAEIHMTLEACLRVDKFERAAALVRRLSSIYTPDTAELKAAQNQYVEGLVAYILRTRSEAHLKSLQRWFEVEMRCNRMKPNATTYALLLKASLQMIQGPKLERTVRRYMDMAARVNYHIEVLRLPILSDIELYKVAKLSPREMFHPDEETLQLDEETVKETYDAEVTRPVTELRSVQQKGLGLQALRRSISIFSDPPMPYPHELQGTEEEKLKAYAMLRQKKIEDDAVISAVERWREENRSLQRLGMNTVLQTRSLGALMWEWQVALKAVVNEELRQIEASEGQPAISRAELDRSLYGPFLRLLSDDKLAAITILSTMSLLSRDTSDRWIRLSSILINVGSAVQEEATAEAIQKQLVPKAWSRPATAERQRKLANMMKRRRTFEALAREVSKEPPLSNDTLNSAPGAWSNAIKVKVGAVLVSALLRTAKMPVPRSNPYTKEDIVQVEPAFFHSYRILHGKSTGVILAHNSLAERLRKEPAQHSLAKHLPMVVEPRKWTSFTDGGFLQYPVNVMRTKGGTAQRRYVEAATARGDMEQVFTGLNILAKTPWKINRAILDVMTEAWNSGEAVADIAPEEPQLEDPVEPPSSADHNEKQQWIKSFREVENKRGGLHSLRCFQNFQLEVARAYANEKFYFPHNVDFRGRAYPTPPYLNHLGADNCRGLLMFADGRELGPAGLVWLKIHLANVYGYDKASFKERERFTLEHLTDIYDSASRPLNGNRWWLSAEDPWQCLATCMELKAALDSPDPSRFVSHLPVHQDGTCNGLQHYAALGGDLWGAKQVNLEPGDRPSDIYTAVAELVKKETARDVERGDPIAKTLLGKITRKVVKQTVMTNVYGVTFAGARAQVRKQLYDIMPEGPEHAGVDHGRMASYVARKIFRALASMFNGAHEIQYWLGECASRICQVITPEQMERMNNSPSSQGAASVAKAKPAPKRGSKDGEIPFMSTVIWTTPLRMPVVQPYYAEKAKVVVTNLQRVHIMESRPKDPVNRRKQLQAFPPNFIHSLDASHMLLSALKCEEAGLTFAAVHDSFWTHAANVDTMNRILRDAFIRIHSEDVIGRLAEEFKVRYKGCLYLASVSRTSTVGKKILAWRGAGSRDKRTGKAVLRGRNKMTELREEYKRQQLLKSDKAEEREEGRKMVTAGSIFEAAASEEDLASDERRVGLGIDDMRKRRGIGGRAALPSTTIGSDDKDVTESDSTTETDEILEKETDAEVEAESHIDSSTDKPPDEEEPEVEETSGKRGRKLDKRVRFWLPLTFPPVPKKGAFDVSRLTNSRYFFC